jgi:NTP pyrophosphatase (non-canonical NTP hydrolase)
MTSEALTFEEYQLRSAETAVYPGSGEGTLDAVVYTTLGLAGEAGEIPNKVKKILRDNYGIVTQEARAAIAAEVGDCLWYVANLAGELGFSLEEIAENNLAKLQSRKERGVLQGSGDNR